MGWEWEVEAYMPLATGEGHYWKALYRGQSRWRTRLARRRGERMGSGCIRTTWRPA